MEFGGKREFQPDDVSKLLKVLKFCDFFKL